MPKKGYKWPASRKLKAKERAKQAPRNAKGKFAKSEEAVITIPAPVLETVPAPLKKRRGRPPKHVPIEIEFLIPKKGRPKGAKDKKPRAKKPKPPPSIDEFLAGPIPSGPTLVPKIRPVPPPKSIDVLLMQGHNPSGPALRPLPIPRTRRTIPPKPLVPKRPPPPIPPKPKIVRRTAPTIPRRPTPPKPYIPGRIAPPIPPKPKRPVPPPKPQKLYSPPPSDFVSYQGRPHKKKHRFTRREGEAIEKYLKRVGRAK